MITNHISTNHSGRAQDARQVLHDRSSEQTLIAAAQSGMTDAMDELLVRHRTALYRAARRFTRSHEDAEDLVQDAMMRAFVNVREFREESQFATWLMAIVNNAAISMKRKGKNVYFLSLESKNEDRNSAPSWDFPDSRPTPEQQTMHEELLAILQTVILQQSRTHQAILKDCVFNEARIADAACSLGLTIGSAKSSLFRAKRRIFDSFERRGLTGTLPLQKTRRADERVRNAENL